MSGKIKLVVSRYFWPVVTPGGNGATIRMFVEGITFSFRQQ